jgi:hypothetical protein
MPASSGLRSALGLPGRGWFQRLQALEDAIAYRRARVTAQCAACGPPSGRKCEDHARDLELIAEYQQTARARPAVSSPERCFSRRLARWRAAVRGSV